MTFRGMLGTYAKFILDPRVLIAAQVNNSPIGVKPAFWFCSSNDFKRIYNNFVDAVDFWDNTTRWRLPAGEPNISRSCVKIKFKQLDD